MRTADEHPEQPSAQILRTQLVGLSERVVGKSIVRKWKYIIIINIPTKYIFTIMFIYQLFIYYLK